MAEAALYLFKAARRALYRKENLHLLAAERGSVVEVAYNQMWVAPEYFDRGAIPRGTPVTFLFTDRPYALFVPVRQGEVVAAEREEPMLRLRVLLRSWVRVEDGDLADFTRRVRETSAGRAPGQKFVLPREDDVPLVAWYDDREDEGWRRVVEGDIAAHTLRVLTSGGVRAHPPECFAPTGDVDIPLEVLGENPELTVQVAPAPAEHTAVTQRLLTRGHESRVRVDAAPGGDVPREELAGLYDVVWRNARFDPGDDLDVLDAFERLLPGEQRIAERRALLLAGRGEDDAAYRILQALNPETLGDDARLCFFRLILQRESGSGTIQRTISLDLTAEGRFGRFIEELARLDAGALGRLLVGLIGELPGDQLRSVMDRVGDRVESASAVVEVAFALYGATGDAAWAYAYLDERRRTLRLAEPAVVEMLVELAGVSGSGIIADDSLGEETARRIGDLLERDEVEEARALLRRAGSALRRAERDRLYHLVADRLARKQRYEAAAEVMVERAWGACETGDLEDATEAVQRARGLWALVGPPAPSWLLEATERVEAAWNACSELVAWRQTDEAWQRSGREVGDRLRGACEAAGVPWVHATSAGVRGVVEGVGSFETSDK